MNYVYEEIKDFQCPTPVLDDYREDEPVESLPSERKFVLLHNLDAEKGRDELPA